MSKRERDREREGGREGGREERGKVREGGTNAAWKGGLPAKN